VGAGAAGTFAAINLLAVDAPLRIVLLERASVFGPGVAYSTQDERHLLNVAAGRMSAFSAEPDHFLDWLRRSGDSDAEPELFAPRRVYGAYLREVLENAVAENGAERFERVQGEAVAATAAPGGLRLELADGRSLRPSRVLLATGPASPRTWPLRGAPPAAAAGSYIADPWAPGALDRIGSEHRVVLIGTGLTMVDVALTLTTRVAQLDAVSRHGVLPLPYPVPVLSEESIPTRRPRSRLLDLFREVRGDAVAATRWQDVIDAIRPQSDELW